MSRLRAIVGLSVSLAIGLVAGCFRDGTPPPAFRYTCEADSDCLSQLLDNMGEPVLDANGDPYAEECINGLCQYSCSGSVLDLVLNPMAVSGCPPDRDGYTCLNGTCNHLCDAAADPPECSGSQTCIEFADFGDIPDLDDLLSNLPQDKPGMCGTLCEADDASTCPDGQLCFDGICVDLGGLPDTNDSSSSSTSGSGSSGDMTGSTGS